MISPLTIDVCNNSFHGSHGPLIFNLETCISAHFPCSHHFFRLHGIYATQSACVSSSGQSTERSWIDCLPTNHLKLKKKVLFTLETFPQENHLKSPISLSSLLFSTLGCGRKGSCGPFPPTALTIIDNIDAPPVEHIWALCHLCS